MELLNYVRRLLHLNQPEETDRKRRASDELPSVINPKFRRVSYLHSIPVRDKPTYIGGNYNSVKNSRNSFQKPYRTHTYMSKENSIEISDDEDEIILLKSKSPRYSHIKHGTEKQTLLKNDEDDDVLFVTCIESNEAKSKRLGYRFFKSKELDTPISERRKSNIPFKMQNRSTPNARKPILSNIYSGSRPTMNESIRLDDKQKFQEMIRKIAPNQNSIFGKYSGNVDVRNRSRRILDLVSKPVIDLTENETAKRLTSKTETRNESPPIVVKDSSDSEIECLGVKSIPVKQPPVFYSNSLKTMLNSKPICSSNWFKDFNEKHERLEEDNLKQIEECKVTAELYREVNKKICEKKLEERFREIIKITDILELDEEKEEATVFPKLTQEQQQQINTALAGKRGPVIIEKFNIRITPRDLTTLAGLNWLNDEVINFYMNLLIERGKTPNRLNVYAFNTFFYPKLLSGGHSSLRRWTKKIDIFYYDLILVPVHLGVHWCMCIIDFRDKSIRYYDSMGGHNSQCTEALLKYLSDERSDKKKEKFPSDEWIMPVAENIPQQMNGSDCGMFSCTYAEFRCRDAKFSFTQEDMPYLRRKMMFEIISGQLLIP